ncbi:MAG: HXXEE domain-containing protein [Tractidigestivibacter sp.]|jgi:hypothetical protein|uniref:HXXEE domain-containing protein n=1 Tax=Tractidigestivibacter sp. TaxID=2847320 RepID=UPI003D937A69
MSMRQKATKLWLSLWLYAMTMVAGVLIGLVVANWEAWDAQTKLVALSTATLSFHVLEEWRFPGGFHYMYNVMADSEKPDRYPMNQLSDMWTNTIGTIVGCLMLAIGVNPMFALMQCLQGVGELFAHTSAGIWALRRYRSQGKRTIYNPGLATSWLGYFPLCCAFVWTFFTQAAPTLVDVVGAVAAGGVLMAVSLPLMERICKDEDTPYAYDWGNGYFERFHD